MPNNILEPYTGRPSVQKEEIIVKEIRLTIKGVKDVHKNDFKNLSSDILKKDGRIT